MEGNKKLKTQYEKQFISYCRKTYKGVQHIKYLQDFLQNNTHLNYKKLDLDDFDEKAIPINEYGNLFEKLYKKVTRQGFLKKRSEIAKKSKKKNQSDLNYYNTSDPFIDDGDMGEEKDFEEPVFSDFKCISESLENFYKSPFYSFTENKRGIDQLQEQNTKALRKVVKPNEQNQQNK